MTTIGLPFFLEDRTGLIQESDYDEIYDRMFLRVESSHQYPSPSPSSSSSSSSSSSLSSSTSHPRICIYDIGRRSPPIITTRAQSSSHSHSRTDNHRPTQTQTYRDPAVILDFAPNGALGTILFLQPSSSSPSHKGESMSVSMPMAHYLRRTSTFGRSSSSSRKFRASDGQDYKWTYRTISDSTNTNPNPRTANLNTGPGTTHEWSCLNMSTNTLIAHYDLKPPCEPTYTTSSGNVLTIYEPFAHLAVEVLSSLLIMRYIAQHNL